MLLPSQNLGNFERTQKIGEGTYGVVYKAFDRINNRVVALKIIKTDDQQGISSTTLREVSMLRLLSHENIITYVQLSIKCSQRLVSFEMLFFTKNKQVELWVCAKVSLPNFLDCITLYPMRPFSVLSSSISIKTWKLTWTPFVRYPNP